MATVILKAKRLIDGSGSVPLHDPCVMIEDGKIAGVFQGEVPASLASGLPEVVDLHDATLLPGLIDCHVHLNLPGDGTSLEDAVAEPDGVLVATSARNARVALDSGVTTLRDCGGRGPTTFQLRRALELGYGIGPRLVLCGQPITITGGHCWYFGGEADNVEGVRQKAREMAKLGADFIKVMGSGGGTRGTKSQLPSFSREEIAALADEAHRLGRRISVHCLCGEAINIACDAGVDHIEHAWFIIDDDGNQSYDPVAVDKLARSGTRVSATLSVGRHAIKAMQDREQEGSLPPGSADRWKMMLEDNLKHFGRLVEAGVEFVAGTDAGWGFTPFTSVVDELELMHEAGLSSSEAIVAATSRAAQALDIDKQTGILREGLAADIIAVEGNPLERLASLRNIRMVMRQGAVYVGAEQTARDSIGVK